MFAQRPISAWRSCALRAVHLVYLLNGQTSAGIGDGRFGPGNHTDSTQALPTPFPAITLILTRRTFWMCTCRVVGARIRVVGLARVPPHPGRFDGLSLIGDCRIKRSRGLGLPMGSHKTVFANIWIAFALQPSTSYLEYSRCYSAHRSPLSDLVS